MSKTILSWFVLFLGIALISVAAGIGTYYPSVSNGLWIGGSCMIPVGILTIIVNYIDR